MTVVRTLGLAVLVGLAIGPVARGDAMRRLARRESLRWGAYRPNDGTAAIIPATLPSPPAAPAPPAPPAAPVPSVPAPSPEPVPAPTPAPAPAEVMSRWSSASQILSAPAPTSMGTVPATPMPAQGSSFTADAFINLGVGPYPEEGNLTAGGAGSWAESAVVQNLFGGRPDAQQRADFTAAILDRVDQTFRQSGIPVTLTTDPTVSAAHTLSVVSNTSYRSNPDAIGIADMGNNGFSFIDKFGFARSVDELEWAVARNVAHELMHAFGVEHHDKTGAFLDAPTSPWTTLIDVNTVFSPEAVKDLLAQDFRRNNNASIVYGAEMVSASDTTVVLPEPSAVALWSLAGCAGLVVARVRRRSA